MLAMCQLSDAQHLIGINNERANYLINATKVMLMELGDKDVDFGEMEKKVIHALDKLEQGHGLTQKMKDAIAWLESRYGRCERKMLDDGRCHLKSRDINYPIQFWIDREGLIS